MGRTAFTEPQRLYKGALYFFLYVTTSASCVSSPNRNMLQLKRIFKVLVLLFTG